MRTLALAAVAVLAACVPVEEGARLIEIPFAAVVNGAPFACDASYDGVGTGAGTIRPVDLRLYVYDVAVLAGGEAVPVSLDDDGAFQGVIEGRGIALLDFEDDAGTCGTGSPDTHTVITGRVPAATAIEGVRFTLGVPEELNHLDAATGPAPLNVPGLWWSWSGGYKFTKIDVASTENAEFFFHHGATTCAGDPAAGFSCAYGNRATVDLALAEAETVQLDLGQLYAGVDVDAPLAEGDFVPGCMAFAGDPECPAMFAPLGLDFESEAASGEAQTLFSVVAEGQQ